MADLDVDLAELLLAALNGAGQELHYISPPAAEEDDSFTEQNGGFVTTTGHRATRHQHQAVFATWDVEQ